VINKLYARLFCRLNLHRYVYYVIRSRERHRRFCRCCYRHDEGHGHLGGCYDYCITWRSI
jgi:hypothetical protein